MKKKGKNDMNKIDHEDKGLKDYDWWENDRKLDKGKKRRKKQQMSKRMKVNRE